MRESLYYKGIKIHAINGLHEKVLDLVKMLPGRCLADIASGPGAMSQRLIDNGFDVLMIDRLDSSDILSKGQRVYYKRDLNDRDWYKNISQSDVVLSLETIEHLENPRAFIRGLKAVTKPNGYILLSTPNIESPISKVWFLLKSRFSWFGEFDYNESGHITPLTDIQIRQICGELSLKIEVTYYTGEYPFIVNTDIKSAIFSLFANMLFFPFGKMASCKVYQIRV